MLAVVTGKNPEGEPCEGRWRLRLVRPAVEVRPSSRGVARECWCPSRAAEGSRVRAVEEGRRDIEKSPSLVQWVVAVRKAVDSVPS